MKEQCSCGAQVSGRHKSVLVWRVTHVCPIRDAMFLPDDEPPKEEPEMQGSHSQAEMAQPRDFEYGERSQYADMPIVHARIGFQPNPPDDTLDKQPDSLQH